MFITFEGIGGAGKTTQTQLLVDWLRSTGADVVSTREPGGTELGEHLRALLLSGNAGIAPRAEAALFAAARAQDADEVIRPALARGAIVIADRFVDSSIVYQGVMEDVGAEDVLTLNLIATAGLLPDITFVLLIDVDIAAERRQKDDKIEPRDRVRRLQIDGAYRELGRIFPDRIVEIDATPAPGEVFERVRLVVTNRLEDKSPTGP